TQVELLRLRILIRSGCSAGTTACSPHRLSLECRECGDPAHEEDATMRPDRGSRVRGVKDLRCDVENRHCDVENLDTAVRHLDIDVEKLDIDVETLGFDVENLDTAVRDLDIAVRNLDIEVENLDLVVVDLPFDA